MFPGTTKWLWLHCVIAQCRGHHKLGRQKWAYPSGQEVEQAGRPSEADCLKCLDAHVKQLHDALMPDSVLLVITGQGDSTQQRHKEVCMLCLNLMCSLFTAFGEPACHQCLLQH